MIPLIGNQILYVAFAMSLFTIVVTFSAQWKGIRAGDVGVLSPNALRWLDVARNAAIAMFVLVTMASVLLEYLFLTNNFAVQAVWDHSAIAQPLFYKAVAFWGGMSGSMLLWAQILAIYIFVMTLWGKRLAKRPGFQDWTRIIPASVAILCVVEGFFLAVIILNANPFTVMVPPIPTDGIGLNPLLQNYWMQIHPPTLYTGYVGCSIPFALAMGALLFRRMDRQWVELSSRWSLFVWVVLFTGIVMGGVWAYETLGWGGYWAWDPVENASLIPWIALTGLVHSMILQQRRNILKSWNVVLASLVFLLSIFGTYLTRSGVVVSVHSFARSNIGSYFLGFLAVVILLIFALVSWRRSDLRSEQSVDTGLCRESLMLAGTWLLVLAAFVVLFGTIYPVIHEAMFGTQITVTKPFYNTVMAPLGLVILFLAGITPLLDWRSMDKKKALRAVGGPVLGALVASPFLYFLSARHTGAATSFVLCVMLVLGIGQLFAKGIVARHKMTGENTVTAFFNLLTLNRRSYGAYIIHLGLASLFIGLTGSSVFKIELDPVLLKPGQLLQVGEYTLKYTGLEVPEHLSPEKDGEIGARLLVAENGVPLKNRDGSPFSMLPYVDFYKPNAEATQTMPNQGEQVAKRPAIYKTLSNDLYLALVDFDKTKNTVTIKAYLNPLVSWVWIAVGIFISGTIISMWPSSRRVSKPPKPLRAYQQIVDNSQTETSEVTNPAQDS
ncbi:MAG: heme lyase CcmF/NrfE family subunit [Abditibacteriaceae bacterium]